MLQADDIITLARGPYRLCAQLGGSAYGVIWRASSPSGVEVALKLVNREQMALAEPAMQGRWVTSAEKEIAFLASLAPWDERHIVRLLDQGTHQGLPVMALELMDTDLARHFTALRASGRKLALSQVLDWMGQINQAMAKVHQYGWLYLDLKPANVLMHAAGASVRLADFGTNRLRAELPAAFYTGTPGWQAPEQVFATAEGTWRTDTRSDYFALGALFYYLVTGGVQLRFCADCGMAYRHKQRDPAATLLARPHRENALTLHADEAALFAQRVTSPDAGGADATWCPSGESATAAAALGLLRRLLAPQRNDRPRHAIEISRALEAIGSAKAKSLAPWLFGAPAVLAPRAA